MKLVIAIIGFFVTYIFFSMLGLGGVTLIVSSAVAIVLYLVVKGGKKPAENVVSMGGIDADFKHDNIAINSKSDKMWVRDAAGNSTVLQKQDVLRWNMASVTNGVLHANNRIEIHVRDLTRPMWSVPFNRHSDTWKSGNQKNFAEVEEWQSRLTTWMNNV